MTIPMRTRKTQHMPKSSIVNAMGGPVRAVGGASAGSVLKDEVGTGVEVT
jgi:hypothetical protein